MVRKYVCGRLGVVKERETVVGMLLYARRTWFQLQKKEIQRQSVMVTRISALFVTPKGKHCKRTFHSI